MTDPTARSRVLANKVLKMFRGENNADMVTAIALVTVAMVARADTLEGAKEVLKIIRDYEDNTLPNEHAAVHGLPIEGTTKQ